MKLAIRIWKATSMPMRQVRRPSPAGRRGPGSAAVLSAGEQRRHGVEDLGVALQLLLGVDHLGLVAGPAGEEVATRRRWP